MNNLVEFWCEVCGQRGFYSYEQAVRDMFEHKNGNHQMRSNNAYPASKQKEND